MALALSQVRGKNFAEMSQDELNGYYVFLKILPSKFLEFHEYASCLAEFSNRQLDCTNTLVKDPSASTKLLTADAEFTLEYKRAFFKLFFPDKVKAVKAAELLALQRKDAKVSLTQANSTLKKAEKKIISLNKKLALLLEKLEKTGDLSQLTPTAFARYERNQAQKAVYEADLIANQTDILVYSKYREELIEFISELRDILPTLELSSLNSASMTTSESVL
jgi:hypothetical protein